MARYSLSRSLIIYILGYPVPEHVYLTRTSRPKLLSDQKVTEIIEYLTESWENRTLNWIYFRDELKLDCIPQSNKATTVSVVLPHAVRPGIYIASDAT
jgi:hypothetical protein